MLKIFNIKKINKNQMRSLNIIHKTFERLSIETISSLCKRQAQVSSAGIKQIKFKNFIKTIPAPAVMGIINMTPIIGNAAIKIDSNITFAIINFIMGGTDEDVMNEQHELTDMEQSLIEGVMARLLTNLKEALSPMLDLQPEIKKIETNPYLLQIAPSDYMSIIITFEVKVGSTEGTIDLCYPYHMLEPIMESASQNPTKPLNKN